MNTRHSKFINITLAILVLGYALPASGEADPGPAIEDKTSVLTLEDCIELALENNPKLVSSSHRAKSAEARAMQEGLLPNPELALEFEEFAGTGEFGDGDVWEATALISQPIELYGKRGKRKDAATKQAELAGWDYESRRLDLILEVKKAFYQALHAQERLARTEDLVGLVEQTHDAVSARVTAGKVSPVELEKSKVELSLAMVELARARAELDSARAALSSLWGSVNPCVFVVSGEFCHARPAPCYEDLLELIDRNPDLARGPDEVEFLEKSVDLEKAEAGSEMEVGFGVRYLAESEDTTYVAELSLPLAIFDRNQGGIERARLEMAAGKEDVRAAEVEAKLLLFQKQRELSSAYAEVCMLRDGALPGAETAFESVSEGYRAGKFNYLDVLDAERTLFETRESYLKALLSYHTAAAEVERIIGGPLPERGTAGFEANGEIK